MLAYVLVHLCGCATRFSPATLAMREVDFPLWTHRYPSGLRVIAEPDKRTQTVGVVLVVGAGSSSDPPGKEGLAHYVEHLAFRSRPGGKNSFEYQLERAGAAYWNAYTSLDETVYEALGSKSALGALLKLEGMRMSEPMAQVAQETYGVQLDVIQNEVRQRNENGFVGEAIGTMQRLLFPADHPYARSIGGSSATINSLTADDAAAFVKKHYRPENMTLEIIGNFELKAIEQVIAESLPKELLERPEGQEAAANDARLSRVIKAPPAPPKLTFVEKEASVATPELWLGWTLPPAFAGSRVYADFARNVVESVLSDVRQWDPDITDIRTSMIRGNQATVLICRALLKKGDHPAKTAGRIVGQIDEYSIVPSNEAWARSQQNAFLRQKQSGQIGSVIEAENLIQRAVKRATTAHVTGDAHAYSKLHAEITGLERSQLVDFVKTYINGDRARIALLHPRKDAPPPPSEIGFRGETMEDEDTDPVVADADELARLAPGMGARFFRHMTLENGLEVILAERPGLPLVSMNLHFLVNLQEPEQVGAARIAQAVGRVHQGNFDSPATYGARTGRYLSKDGPIYSLLGASGNAGTMLGALAEQVTKQSIVPFEWDEYRRKQIHHQQVAELRPQVIADRKFLDAFFRGQGIAWTLPISGWVNTPVERAQQWLTETHAPNNAVLVIAGEFDPGEVERGVRESFGAWAASSRTFPPAAALRPGAKATETVFVAVHKPGATQAKIRFGCVLSPAKTAALDARHDVGAALLQERLRQSLRNKGGVAYDITASAWTSRGGTTRLEITGAAEQTKLVYALTAIKKTLEDLGASAATERDLARMKLRLARRHTARFMSNESIADHLATMISLGYSPADLDHFASFLDKTTLEDVQQDFKDCMKGNPTLMLLGDEATIRAAFKDGWQAPPPNAADSQQQ